MPIAAIAITILVLSILVRVVKCPVCSGFGYYVANITTGEKRICSVCGGNGFKPWKR